MSFKLLLTENCINLNTEVFVKGLRYMTVTHESGFAKHLEFLIMGSY